MSRNISFLAYIYMILMFASCSNHTKTNAIIRMELPSASIIADTLFTQFPGTLRVSSEHILLETPFDQDGFLKVYDRITGKEIDWIGKIGRGPGEWGTPSIGNMINDKLVVFDLNERKYVLAGLENQYRDISNPDSIKKIDVMANRLNIAGQQQIIVADFIDEIHPFKIITNGNSIAFGKYPFDENIINALDCLQGHILTHPQMHTMVYATIDLPYLSFYNLKDSINLLWENQFGVADYNIKNGVLTWNKNQLSGVGDICFTKDYIACLVIDPENIDKKHQTVLRGRKMAISIHSVYLFDYQGHLSYILDLPVLAIRLASDVQSNTLYLVAIEPDYSIIKYDLSEYGI